MLRDLLRLEGQPVGRKHVRALMKKMGVEAIYRKPNLSKRHDAHLIYPYLLRDLAINRPNQVWATVTVDNATPQGATYRCENSVQTNGTTAICQDWSC